MDAVIEYSALMGQGLLVTILVTVLGAALTILVAFAAGLAGLSQHGFLRWPSYIFVEFFRGSGLLVQMFWFFYALPFLGIELNPVFAGVLALGLNEGAYAAEVVRGTIRSRPRGQTEAAIALGMGPVKRLWRILIPQSIPAMLPSFGNVMVDLLKNTSLVSLVTVSDLTWRAFNARTVTGATVELFLTILVIYYLLSLGIGWITRFLERRFALDRKALRDTRKRTLIGAVSR
ncbi:ectoine/hydroxyectoine ABC transporter permease subunit EhuC [Leucobacter sp. CSA2]|uniref:Ectoine/hydroxyectoine ABC transporter permease subunit EhuC n=1 Tax=Leucobacter edaphi TaxID=2796472 RepID=A0A934UXR7_9MICO|nr:ectoine/hydroxyectoine ABC transporter permease subunit EhuC [Leucobacter edaphi]MBK0421911.1 ectoine/hydroxyectoine ABC transporter permease subunit EhuC [Leucobacter edaphi]